MDTMITRLKLENDERLTWGAIAELVLAEGELVSGAWRWDFQRAIVLEGGIGQRAG